MQMKQNKRSNFADRKCTIIIILMLLIFGILGFYAINVYASAFDLESLIADGSSMIGGTMTNDESNEETLVRMTTSLSKGLELDNKVNADTLEYFLNKYVGTGGVNVQVASNDLIEILFNKTGNLYEVNINFGYIFDIIEDSVYTITYDAKGGNGGLPTQIGFKGQSTIISTLKPKKDGYTFLGWSTSSSAVTPEYIAGSSYTGDEDITLYAVWEGDTYMIEYNANGGTGAPAIQSIIHGETITLSSTIPTRTGYEFIGWHTNPLATAVLYIPGQTYSINGNTTLYAIWEEVETYTITYNANGGTGAPSQQTLVYGDSISLAEAIPTKEGYTFLGWATTATATTKQYSPGQSYSVYENKTLYAVWEEDKQESATTYTITFDANQGSGAPDAITTNADGTATIPTTVPTRTFMSFMKYTFLGWSTSSSATEATYSAGSTISAEDIAGTVDETGTMTLYAVWKSPW